MKNLAVFIVLSALLLTGCGGSSPQFLFPANAQIAPRPIVIVGTSPDETTYLESQMVVEQQESIQRRRVLIGTIGDLRVVVATVGVGSINSSSGVSLLVERFNPTAVILSGVAGGLGDAQPGDVVVARQIINYGFGQLNDQGYAPWPTYQTDFVTRNPLYFEATPDLVASALQAGNAITLPSISFNGNTRQPKVIEGIIESEQIFSEVKSRNEEVRLETGANTFEEEGAAIAQTCFQLDIPFLVIRGISNEAAEDGFIVYNQLSGVVSENANRVVLALLSDPSRPASLKQP